MKGQREAFSESESESELQLHFPNPLLNFLSMWEPSVCNFHGSEHCTWHIANGSSLANDATHDMPSFGGIG